MDYRIYWSLLHKAWCAKGANRRSKEHMGKALIVVNFNRDRSSDFLIGIAICFLNANIEDSVIIDTSGIRKYGL